MKKRYILTVLIFFVAVLAGYLYYLMLPVSSDSHSMVIEIPKQSGVKDIAEILSDKGIIKSPAAFEVKVWLKNKAGVLKAGKYAVSPNMNLNEIIKKLELGDVVDDTIKVTFPEGYTIRDMAYKLERLGIVSHEDFAAAVTSYDTSVYDYLDIPNDRFFRLEGYLYPDTYTFKVDANPKDIINTMLTRFNVIYESNIKGNLGGRKLEDVMKVASMIEKEAVIDEDRSKIASVIYNRLNRGMKLQIDATVQYAIGSHKEILTLKDLNVSSKYNTYKVVGLPLGPVANPGLKSIMAALKPDKTDYIYYVARKDGSHYFTKSYQDFLNQKKVYKEDK